MKIKIKESTWDLMEVIFHTTFEDDEDE